MPHSKLFDPIRLNDSATSRNRWCLAPMTNTQSEEDGVVGADEKKWLESQASAGFGLVLTCAAYVMRQGKAWDGQMGAYREDLLPGLKDLTEAVRLEGALPILQLFHGGARAPSFLTGSQPVSASSFYMDVPGFEEPRALGFEEIDDIVEAFASATALAKRAGFAGVEIHGANGYLITQFLSTETNLRSDEYGGDLEGRARFLMEIMERCRSAVTPSFLIGVRLSPEGIGLDLDETVTVARWLVGKGADFIDISHIDVAAPAQKYPDDNRPVFAYFREAVGEEILIAGGGIVSSEQADAALEAGADLVFAGRGAIGNADFVNRLKSGEKLDPPPYSRAHLQDIGRTNRFINYTKKLPIPVMVE